MISILDDLNLETLEYIIILLFIGLVIAIYLNVKYMKKINIFENMINTLSLSPLDNPSTKSISLF